MNPVLPSEHFVPDSEARVMPDGRLYVYGSYDLSGNMNYCSNVLHVFSTENLVAWVDHGVSFSTKDIPWANEESILYAPDCIYRDGKYYLYFCLSDNTEGVAVSDFPYGPFKSPTIIPHASGDSIDPAVFIDDDGQAYYFWGQFSLRAAQMNNNMQSLKSETIIKDLIDEKRHGFHEGASVRKYKDTYILLYTCIFRGKATCLAHATAKHPLGPYTYRGIVIDNIGTDPNAWNNHGSVECFKDKWYVFYHRSSQNSNFSRRLCIEPIEISDDGFIQEVFPTSQGVQPPIPSNHPIPASCACRLGGWGTHAYIAPDPITHQNEAILNASGEGFAIYRDLSFDGTEISAHIEYFCDTQGSFEVWINDKRISILPFQPCVESYQTASAPTGTVSGTHTLYLTWNIKSGAATIKSIRFIRSLSQIP